MLCKVMDATVAPLGRFKKPLTLQSKTTKRLSFTLLFCFTDQLVRLRAGWLASGGVLILNRTFSY